MGKMQGSRYRWCLQLRDTSGVWAVRLNRGPVANLMMMDGDSSVLGGATGTKARELRFLMWHL